MALKTYKICIEKDVDIITQAQTVVALSHNGWTAITLDHINPMLVTYYKWVDIECDDIEVYTKAINAVDATLRVVDVIEK